MKVFLERPIEGDWPYLWLDATYVKARRDHHIVSVAVVKRSASPSILPNSALTLQS